MQKKQKKAFSLIELSIVILIVSILITGSLGISKTAINNSRTKVTKERMDEVYKAISNFLSINKRLPCPAILSVTKNTSGYGDEASTPGTCTSTFASSTNAPNLSYGMVPTKALGLDPDFAEDGFGTKFTYVVDKRFTKRSSDITYTDGFEIIQGTRDYGDSPHHGATEDLGSVDVQSPSGTSILANKNAILLLISHGANKFNGFNASGTAKNGASTISDENNNSCNTCNTSDTYDRTFITNSSDPNFDDITLFKAKIDLVRDAGLEFIMCNAEEARYGLITWSKNSLYGCSLCAAGGTYTRTCGKYGLWNMIINTGCTADEMICP